MDKLLKTVIALMLTSGMVQADYVMIGDVGNAGDPNNDGHGAVGYEYKISDHEVTIAEFQQATGAGDGDEGYWNDGSRTVGSRAPASNVSLLEAMKYCNWLTSGNVGQGAYSVNESGEGSFSVNRTAALAVYGTIYVLPTYNEWHKAAYYTGNTLDPWSLYANGTDTSPIHGSTSGWNYYNGSYVNGSPNYTWESGYGAKEQNGTYDMMGNVSEWTENASDLHRGGHYLSSLSEIDAEYPGNDSAGAMYEHRMIGFRVVAVPEPSTVLLFGIGGMGAWLLRRNRMKAQQEEV